MRVPLSKRLGAGVMLCDGAMGTMLYDRGVSRDISCDSSSLSDPALVKDIHHEYLLAGAEIIETNSFGGNTVRLATYGLANRAREISFASARIASKIRDEVNRDALVAGSIGPTGLLYGATLGAGRNQTVDAFAPQIDGLLAGGVDLFIAETFSDLEEIAVVVEAIRRRSDLPVVALMTFGADSLTSRGVPPETCAEYLSSLPVEIIGANCSVGPEAIVTVIQRMSARSSKPLCAMPNAGLPRLAVGKYVYNQTPNDFAGHAMKLVKAGVRLIGGCCGTTPEYIRQIDALLRSDNLSTSPDG